MIHLKKTKSISQKTNVQQMLDAILSRSCVGQTVLLKWAIQQKIGEMWTYCQIFFSRRFCPLKQKVFDLSFIRFKDLYFCFTEIPRILREAREKINAPSFKFKSNLVVYAKSQFYRLFRFL